jgi:Xaa-Pro aminopeptidase
MIGRHRYRERVSRLADGGPFLVSRRGNLIYLTGCDAALYLVVPASGEPIALTARMEADRFRRCSWISNVRAFEGSEIPLRRGEEVLFLPRIEALKEILRELGIEALRFDSLSEKVHSDLSEFGPQRSEAVEEMRLIKSRDEIRLIEEARRHIGRAYEEVSSGLEEESTELELAGRIHHATMAGGAESAFEPIVAFDTNSSYPHHSPTGKRLGRSSVVVLDLGAKVEGYCSDITRTILACSGPAEGSLEAVRRAIERVSDALEPGMRLSDADAIARDALGQEAAYMTHSLGHGLGLAVHEGPYLSPGSEEVLREGMVFTIEPGVYHRGRYGVRWEEDFACLKGKVRLL